MLVPPKGKPKKWDAADAIEEGFDISNFLNAPVHKVKKSLSLKNQNLLITQQFVGVGSRAKVFNWRYDTAWSASGVCSRRG